VAAAHGFNAVVSALLAAGADISVSSRNGSSPLHAAAAGGHAKCIALLAREKSLLDRPNHHKDTALILAAKSRCSECVRILLDAGADARLRNADALTAADVARLGGDGALVELID